MRCALRVVAIGPAPALPSQRVANGRAGIIANLGCRAPRERGSIEGALPRSLGRAASAVDRPVLTRRSMALQPFSKSRFAGWRDCDPLRIACGRALHVDQAVGLEAGE